MYCTNIRTNDLIKTMLLWFDNDVLILTAETSGSSPIWQPKQILRGLIHSTNWPFKVNIFCRFFKALNLADTFYKKH